MGSVEALKARFEEEFEKLKQLEKDQGKNIQNRQVVEVKLSENNCVKEELDLLEEDAAVYKLVGPVLVKQDIAEARQNVDKRIDYLTAELKRLDETITDTSTKQEAQKEVVSKIQKALKQKASASEH